MKKIPAGDLVKLIREAGYDWSLPHPQCYEHFSYLHYTDKIIEYLEKKEND